MVRLIVVLLQVTDQVEQTVVIELLVDRELISLLEAQLTFQVVDHLALLADTLRQHLELLVEVQCELLRSDRQINLHVGLET